MRAKCAKCAKCARGVLGVPSVPWVYWACQVCHVCPMCSVCQVCHVCQVCQVVCFCALTHVLKRLRSSLSRLELQRTFVVRNVANRGKAPPMYDKIVEACKSGNWDEASNWAIERARKQFDSFDETGEFDKFTEMLQHAKAVQIFDPMKVALDNATAQCSDTVNGPKHREFGRAYKEMINMMQSYSRCSKASWAEWSKAALGERFKFFRDVIVVECIRAAGTHAVEAQLIDALAEAFDVDFSAIGREETLEKHVLAVMLNSYHRLLEGAPSVFRSHSSCEKRRPRPARIRNKKGRSASPGQERSSSAPRARSNSVRIAPRTQQRRSVSTRRVQIQVDGEENRHGQPDRYSQETDRGTHAARQVQSAPQCMQTLLERIEGLEWQGQQWQDHEMHTYSYLLFRVDHLEQQALRDQQLESQNAALALKVIQLESSVQALLSSSRVSQLQ